MDILFIAAKAAFYDMPLSVAGRMAWDGRNMNWFGEALRETLAREDKAYTATDANNVVEMLNEGLISSDKETHRKSWPLLQKLPYLLYTYGDKTLHHCGEWPRVEFDNLLRWRRLALLIGEDCLTTATLTGRDRDECTNFLWPDTIEHDNKEINYFFSKGLSDAHSHLYASTDVAAINWLCVCNYPEAITKAKLFSKHWSRDYDLVRSHTEDELTLVEWAIVAAAIRVRLYEKFCLKQDTDYKEIENALRNKFARLSLAEDTANRTGALRCGGNIATAFNKLKVDYCIRKEDIDASPYSILVGERRLLFSYFESYFHEDKDALEWWPYVYIYLLAKTKLRREMVQTNGLRGFANFKAYQANDYGLCPMNQYIGVAERYAVQSAIWGGHNVETRVQPFVMDKKIGGLLQPIFNDCEEIAARRGDVTVVAHFLKGGDDQNRRGNIRFNKLRNSLNRQLSFLLKAMQSNAGMLSDWLVGIDAAGSELDCPPEVFGPIYRRARENGINNFTFHVGEDFHDLLSGLRAIDEAINYLDLSNGCRIGHAMALGINALQYYDERHNYIVAPQQALLDNLVWMRHVAGKYNIELSSYTKDLIENEAKHIVADMGYGSSDIESYWQSMKVRGCSTATRPESEYVKHGKDWREPCKAAQSLYNEYLYSERCRERGKQVTTIKTKSYFADDVARLQEAMLIEIERLGIIIETCPSSNLAIGTANRYDKLPLFRLNSPDDTGHIVPVSINTDDRGIFATSITNEYSLIAVTMHKCRDEKGNWKYSDRRVADYIRRIAECGNMSRFDKGEK